MTVTMSAPAPSDWEPSSSLARFYAEVFRPSAAWHVSDYRLRIYDQTVQRLIAHCGGASPSLGEVTDELIEELLAAQFDNRSKDWRKQIASCLRRIVRAWNPLTILRERVPDLKAGTLREHFENCYIPERLTGARPHTIPEYRTALKAFHAYVGRDVLLSELSDGLVAGFLKAVRESDRSIATVNKFRAHLLAIWRNAHEHRLVDTLPRIRKWKEPRDVPVAWRLEELQAIFAAAGIFEPQKWYGPVPCNLFWLALLQVAYETAARRGSLLAIRLADVNLKHATVYIAGADMKDHDGQGYQLSRSAIKAIGHIASPPREFLFYTDQSVKVEAFGHRIARDFKRIIAAAGLDPGRGRGLNLFHKIRRTAATQLAIRSGIAAAATLLGHDSEYVTSRYVDRTQLPQRDGGSQLPPLDPPQAAAG